MSICRNKRKCTILGEKNMQHTKYTNPPLLKEGATLGIYAPASPMLSGRLDAGIPYLEQLGFKVKLGKHIHQCNRFLAGTDEERAEDINDFFQDDEVDGLLATGGGYGTQRLLPLLDFKRIENNPKPLIGFSDLTGLNLALLKKANLISYTGFTLADTQHDGAACKPDLLIETTMMNLLLGKPYEISGATTGKAGRVEGPLIGGNSDLIVALHGTPYQPDYTNCILLIEEVRLEPYKVDAMLSHLWLTGLFEQVAGVVFGQFDNCIAKNFPERDGTVDDVINEWAAKMSVPCIKDLPFGHGARRCCLPIGRRVILDADTATLFVPNQ
jgi:muramoyltetrapeptide carboxypeptidase